MELVPMKTRRRVDDAATARFLTFSCFQRLPLFGNDRVKDRFVERFEAVVARQGVRVLAWVVMPEHVHLVVDADGDGFVPRFLRALKRPFAHEVLNRWRALDAPVLPRLRDRQGRLHFWQVGGGYDRNEWGDALRSKIAYTNTNPVERGLVARSVDWPWSSARAYEGRADAWGPAIAFDWVPDGKGVLT